MMCLVFDNKDMMKEIRLTQLQKSFRTGDWEVYLYKDAKETFKNQKIANAFLVKISKDLSESLRQINHSYQGVLSQSQSIIFNLDFEGHCKYNSLKRIIDERTFFILRRYASHNNSFYFSTLLLIAYSILDLMQVVENFGKKISINPFEVPFSNYRLAIDHHINVIRSIGNISLTNYHANLNEDSDTATAV